MTETCAAVSMVSFSLILHESKTCLHILSCPKWPVSQKVGTLGSGGQLVSGTTVKVVKPNGALAQIGESGELYVRGPQVVLGYYQNEAA